MVVGVEAVRRFRFERHQLDRDPVGGRARPPRVVVETWKSLTKAERAGLEEQADRLAVHRGVTLAGLAFD